MSVLELPPERRQRRSSQAGRAIMLQLESIFEREELRNFTLGDAHGLVIASAGDSAESDVLAAYAPVLARTFDRERRANVMAKIQQFMPDVDASSLHVRAFEIDGEPLFLALLGQPGIYQHVGLYRAITGVRRILSESGLGT